MVFESVVLLWDAESPEAAAIRIREKLKAMDRIASKHYLTRLTWGLYRFIIQDHPAAKQAGGGCACPEIQASNPLTALVLCFQAKTHQALGETPGAEERRAVDEWVRSTPNDADARSWRGSWLARRDAMRRRCRISTRH